MSSDRFVKVVSSGAQDVAAGTYHSFMLKQDGSLWAAGLNSYGQLGDGTNIDRTVFVEAVSSDVKAVAAGTHHSMILKQNGSVWTTGFNIYGQLGDGSLRAAENSFVQAANIGTWGNDIVSTSYLHER